MPLRLTTEEVQVMLTYQGVVNRDDLSLIKEPEMHLNLVFLWVTKVINKDNAKGFRIKLYHLWKL